MPSLFYLRLSVDEADRQDRKRLQHLREAIELMSTVAIVNNKTFTNFMRVGTITHSFFMPGRVFT